MSNTNGGKLKIFYIPTFIFSQNFPLSHFSILPSKQNLKDKETKGEQTTRIMSRSCLCPLTIRDKKGKKFWDFKERYVERKGIISRGKGGNIFRGCCQGRIQKFNLRWVPLDFKL
jgi:hypothetical protein